MSRCEFAALAGVSPVYETEPVEVEGGQPEYLNCAVEMSCGAGVVELLRYCQGVEAALGRSEKGEKTPRTVDIDVLLYGEEQLDTSELAVPHQGITRAFNLVTLADLDPGLYIPGLGVAGEALSRIEATELAGVRLVGRLEEA